LREDAFDDFTTQNFLKPSRDNIVLEFSVHGRLARKVIRDSIFLLAQFDKSQRDYWLKKNTRRLRRHANHSLAGVVLQLWPWEAQWILQGRSQGRPTCLVLITSGSTISNHRRGNLCIRSSLHCCLFCLLVVL
jgi:hypothetical protein